MDADIKLLQEQGFDLIKIKSSPNKYYIASREFELPELKLLIDAVQSSRFITEKKSHELSKKLAGLASAEQAKELDRHTGVNGRAKSTNEKQLYTVDTITKAINEKKKIRYQYQEYDGKKRKILRNDGEVYVLSPYMLYWNEDFYYAVGYSDKRECITAFRVDRIVSNRRNSEKKINSNIYNRKLCWRNTNLRILEQRKILIMNISRDNHYVPKMYLKNWENNDKVQEYRLLVSNKNVPIWKGSSIRRIGFQKDLYVGIVDSEENDDFETKFNIQFETPAADALKKACKGERLTPDEWDKLLDFVAAQYVRVPAFYLFLTDAGKEIVPKTLNEVCKELEELTEVPIIQSQSEENKYLPLSIKKTNIKTDATELFYAV